MGATAELSRFIAETDGRAIPPAAIALARTAFVDVTATTLAGAAEPVGRIVTAWVREAGGTPAASAPQTGLEGKPSLEFCAAVAMLDGRLGLDAFTDARVVDATTRAMMARVKSYVDPALDRGAPGVARDPMGDRTTVTIVLHDGREVAETVRFARGSPENPMSREELVSKYRECATLSLGTAQAERALELLERLDEVPSIGPLMEALRG